MTKSLMLRSPSSMVMGKYATIFVSLKIADPHFPHLHMQVIASPYILFSASKFQLLPKLTSSRDYQHRSIWRKYSHVILNSTAT